MNGRGEIASELRKIFADHLTATYVAKVREVRALSSQAALVRAGVGIVPPGKAALNPAGNAIQSVLVVAETGGIKVDLLQNTRATFQGQFPMSLAHGRSVHVYSVA